MRSFCSRETVYILLLNVYVLCAHDPGGEGHQTGVKTDRSKKTNHWASFMRGRGGTKLSPPLTHSLLSVENKGLSFLFFFSSLLASHLSSLSFSSLLTYSLIHTNNTLATTTNKH